MNTSMHDQSQLQIRRALVSENPITRRLYADGWPPEDLDQVVLSPCDRSRPFTQWLLQLPAGRAISASEPRRLRAHAALKVLMLNDLPFSEGEQEAWTFIASVTLEMVEEAYLGHVEAQQIRATAPRPRIAANGASVQEVIARLATCPEHEDAPPRDLWQRFEAAMEGCTPVWLNQTSRPRDWVIKYDSVSSVPETGEAARKIMGYPQFCRLVREARKTKKRH